MLEANSMVSLTQNNSPEGNLTKRQIGLKEQKNNQQLEFHIW
jgi:hypothetical protein